MQLSTIMTRLQLPPFVCGRPRLFIGLLCGLLAFPLLPHWLSARTRAIWAWDAGVIVFLALAIALFLTEPPEDMPAHAAANSPAPRICRPEGAACTSRWWR